MRTIADLSADGAFAVAAPSSVMKEGDLMPLGTELRTAVRTNICCAHDEEIAKAKNDKDGDKNDEKMHLLRFSEPIDLARRKKDSTQSEHEKK